MWRSLHSLPGVFSLLLVAALAISGSMLAFFPVRDGLAPQVQAVSGLTVADAVSAVSASNSDIDTLQQSPSGSFVLNYFDASGNPQQDYVDIHSGTSLTPVPIGPSFFETLRTFHRSLFLGDRGRWVSAGAGLLVVLLSISGLFMMVARLGGWANLFDRPKGNWSARVHTIFSRLMVLPLVFSSITGIYITLAEFDIVHVVNAESATFPQSVDGALAVAVADMPSLKAIPLGDLRELTFPIPGDPTDVFTVKTAHDIRYVDQASGQVLEVVPYTTSETIYEWVYKLHTGVGMAWVGVLLGLASLTVPLIGVTGVIIWWKRTRGAKRRIKGSAAAHNADIVVLVGSEGGTTWGFARSLHRDLQAAGHVVHVAPMNDLKNQYAKAKHMIFLTSTYGTGSAPESANKFMQKLGDLPEKPDWSFSVLGFGDRSFPKFCQFSKDLDEKLESQGWRRLCPLTFVNRQSTQAFATWGNEMAAHLGEDFKISHVVSLPTTRHLVLHSKEVYGADPDALTAVLRFKYTEGAKATLVDRLLGRDGKRPRFASGDLLGVISPASGTPRFYSVASAPSNVAAEICVKKQVNGECSGYLHNLKAGDTVGCFIKTNADFALPGGKKPVIMISAGTGIAPFMGMIRANARTRPLHLFWGGRTPDADFLYRDDLAQLEASNHLTSLTTAFSRVEQRAYVQDRLRENHAWIGAMVAKGAGIMVCGGDAMAQAVAAEMETILRKQNLSVAKLKGRGLYQEDVF